MKLFHDSEKAKEIEEKLRTHFLSEREERTVVHLSDTTRCPMKFYNRMTGMEPLPIDSGGIGAMSLGNAGQTVLQQLYDDDLCEFEHEFMPSHIDIMEEGKFPIEIKWSSARIFRAADVPDSWVKQLMGYIAIHDAPYGWLAIMNLYTRRWTFFKMIMDAEERADYRAFLLLFKMILPKTVEQELPEGLLRWMKPEEERTWECKRCEYRPDRRRKVKRIEGERCNFYVSSRKKKA